MKKVNLYAYSSIKGIKASDGAVGYVLEYETEKGPYTKDCKHTVYGLTRQQADLEVLNEALSKIREQCEVLIFIKSKSILGAWKNGWLDQWMENDGKKANGEEIANREDWQQFYTYTCKHSVEITDEHHSYENWLTEEVEKLKNSINTL